jgi:hypothetical protein
MALIALFASYSPAFGDYRFGSSGQSIAGAFEASSSL